MRALILMFFLPLICFSQVGINTTSPNASLDIQSSNQATPANTDGILIPKIDEYPSVNPTVAQDGMIVFASGTGSVTKGFYYWDNTTTSWKPFSGTTIEKIDDLIDGKSDNDGTDNGSSIFLGKDAGLNDDGTNNSNVAIGPYSLRDNTTGNNNSALGNEALIFNTIGYQNTALGQKAMNFNITGFSNTAIGHKALRDNVTGSNNVVVGLSAGENSNGSNNVFIGHFTGYNSIGSDNVFLGRLAGYSESNGDRLYIENSISTSPLIYGEFDNDLLRVNGDFEVEKVTDASIIVKTPFGDKSSLKLFESGGSGDYGFEFQYDGTPDKLHLWSRTFAGNEGIRMTWLKNGSVGINDISPMALLDIEATNSATPTNKDGILIPRVDAFPASNPTADQNGMLVFLTTDNLFYYWKNGTTSWAKVNVERINDLVDGKSDNDGSNNGSSIFLGVNAGTNDNETNNHNVGIGYNAMTNTINGSYNTAIGFEVLESNTSGVYNSAFGSEALNSSTSGSNNSAFGRRALMSMTTGYLNTSIGNNAMQNSTESHDNVAIGYQSLLNSNGNYNVAIGNQSLDNGGGDFNVAIGYQSLYSNSFNDNVAIGYQSLYSNISNSNTAIGSLSLRNNSVGYHNTAIGYSSLNSNLGGVYNVAIGSSSLELNIAGDYNVAIGNKSLVNTTNANHNTAVGYQALENITGGNSNTAIGSNSGPLIPAISNTTAIGYNAVPLVSNQVRIGNGSVLTIGGSVAWSVISDKRLKTNIKEDIAGLDFIKKLRPVSYNLDMDAIAHFEKTPDSLRLRDAEQLKAKEIQTGFIAQEVEAAANEVGFDFHGIVKPYNSDGTYALRYSEFVVPLVKAMQEQQDIIEAQKEELKAIRQEIEEIKALLKKD